MIKLITGGTGDGKTLLAVTRLLEEIERNKKANAVGEGNKGYEEIREFRTNIKGVVGRIAGVKELEKDWRQYPDGSYLIYDESHKKGWFRTTGKPGLSDDDVITELDEHRHRGFDITFITQFPTKIHNEVRQLVKHHTHCHRAFSMQRAALFEWSRCINDPYDEKNREGVDESLWEFPAENYKLYDSASLHTHKFQMPKKIKTALITAPFVVAVFALMAYMLIPSAPAEAETIEGSSTQAAGGAAGAAARPVSHTSEVDSWKVAAVMPAISGCAILTKSCRCWNGEGQQLDLNHAQCLNLANSPLPLDFSRGREGAKKPDQRVIRAASPYGGALDSALNTKQLGFAGEGITTEPNSVGTTENASHGWLKQ